MIRPSLGTLIKACPAAAVLALACVTTFPTTSAGQGFELMINEKEMMLAHPNDVGMMHYATWDTGFQRILDRNMPFVQLFNDENSTSPITELRLTIGDDRFNFGNTALMFHGLYTMVGRTNPDAIITSHVEDAGDELVVNFGNGGVQPGQRVNFRINLDVDAGHPNIYPYPDFRTVLFDMNGIQVYDGGGVDFDDSDNAKATVKFATPSPPPLEVGPLFFPDEIVLGAEQFFSNRVYRPYGIMEGAPTFGVGTGAEEVPEPTSAALGFVGCVGGAMLAARARRRYADGGVHVQG